MSSCFCSAKECEYNDGGGECFFYNPDEDMETSICIKYKPRNTREGE